MDFNHPLIESPVSYHLTTPSIDLWHSWSLNTWWPPNPTYNSPGVLTLDDHPTPPIDLW